MPLVERGAPLLSSSKHKIWLRLVKLTWEPITISSVLVDWIYVLKNFMTTPTFWDYLNGAQKMSYHEKVHLDIQTLLDHFGWSPNDELPRESSSCPLNI